MTPFAFDTLSASKQLREAGMEQGVAEAVVAVFQHAATMPDISHLATKDDLEALRLATKSDVEALRLATKADVEALHLATKADVEALRIGAKSDILDLEVRLMERMRQQIWATLGGMAVLLAISTAIGKLVA